MNLGDSSTQTIGFSLALVNILAVAGLNGVLFLDNMKSISSNPSYSVFDMFLTAFFIFLPQTISMYGSISYSVYIALD